MQAGNKRENIDQTAERRNAPLPLVTNKKYSQENVMMILQTCIIYNFSIKIITFTMFLVWLLYCTKYNDSYMPK